jgi:hypothetical protein
MRMTKFLTVMTVAMGATFAARAADDWKTLDAQKLIDACWAISEEDRSAPSRQQMMEGREKTLHCFEETLVEQVRVFRPYARWEGYKDDDIRKILHAIATNLTNIEWYMYKSLAPDACLPDCQPLAYGPMIEKVYQELIREVVVERKAAKK